MVDWNVGNGIAKRIMDSMSAFKAVHAMFPGVVAHLEFEGMRTYLERAGVHPSVAHALMRTARRDSMGHDAIRRAIDFHREFGKLYFRHEVYAMEIHGQGFSSTCVEMDYTSPKSWNSSIARAAAYEASPSFAYHDKEFARVDLQWPGISYESMLRGTSEDA